MNINPSKLCPKCGKSYTGYSAVSRVGFGDICSRCGKVEALEAMGMDSDKIQVIVDNMEAREAEIRQQVEDLNAELRSERER